MEWVESTIQSQCHGWRGSYNTNHIVSTSTETVSYTVSTVDAQIHSLTENWAYGHFHAKFGIYQFGRERRLRSNLTSSLRSCTQVFESAWSCGAA